MGLYVVSLLERLPVHCSWLSYDFWSVGLFVVSVLGRLGHATREHKPVPTVYGNR
jgi:hypothetical protein